MSLVIIAENFANLLKFPLYCLSKSSLVIFFKRFGERDLSLTDCFYLDFEDAEFLSAFSLSFFNPLIKFGVLFYLIVKQAGSRVFFVGFGGVILICGGLCAIFCECLRVLRNFGERHPWFLVLKGTNMKSTIFDTKLFFFFLNYTQEQFPNLCVSIFSIFSSENFK